MSLNTDGIPLRVRAHFFPALWEFFSPLFPPHFELRKKEEKVPAMADISSLLSLLEDKHRQAKQQCDDEKARNIAWLEETVANTKKQLLHRL